MKKYLVAISILAIAIFAGVVYAENSSIAYRNFDTIPDRFGGVVTLTGKMPRSTSIVVDNTARTLDNLVVTGSGTYLGGSDNTLTPIAATISCVDNVTRWGFGITPSTTVGHRLPAATFWQISGPDAMGRLQAHNDTATDNVACAITLWY